MARPGRQNYMNRLNPCHRVDVHNFSSKTIEGLSGLTDFDCLNHVWITILNKKLTSSTHLFRIIFDYIVEMLKVMFFDEDVESQVIHFGDDKIR